MADLNGDGLLDIVVGGGQNAVYLNQGGGVFPDEGTPFGTGDDSAESVAVGDLNGDGLLDIVVGGGQNAVYLNQGNGVFEAKRLVHDDPLGPDYVDTRSVAVGDLNADGLLDIVVGNRKNPIDYIWEGLEDSSGWNEVYLNQGGGVFAAKFFGSSDYTLSVAVGDLNGDGLPDIVVGNAGEQNVVYFNQGGGVFGSEGEPFGPNSDSTLSVTVGYLNDDDLLDIVVGNYGEQNAVYLNQGRGVFGSVGEPFGPGDDNTTSVAVGDLNGDDLLDIIVGNYGEQNAVYLNQGGGVFGSEGDSFGPGTDGTRSVAVGDLNGHGTLDIVVGNGFDGDNYTVQSMEIRIANRGGGAAGDEAQLVNNAIAFRLPLGATRNAQMLSFGNGGIEFSNAQGILGNFDDKITWGDRVAALWPVSASAAITAHTPLRRFVTPGYATERPDSTVPSKMITSTLTVADPRRMGPIEVTVGFSISPTKKSPDLTFALFDPAGNEINLVDFTPELAARHALTEGVQIYNMAFTADGAQLLPLTGSVLAQPAPITLTVAATTTAALKSLAGTMVDGDWKLVVTNRMTDTEVLLTGWSINTRLVPLYYGSAPPSPDGTSLDLQEVTAGGVQTVTTTYTLPLMLFDLDVALEWDAQEDEKFLHQLETDLQRASDFLFDWTNGQVALGAITVYHDAKTRATGYPTNPWLDADVRIYATNRLRPSAVKGGIVSEPVTDTVTLGESGTETEVIYFPGRVHMGAVWNRFGRSDGNLGEDWPRTLAHELGHYLLFLDDNYVGLQNGMLTPVNDCPGAMADHYRDDSGTGGYGEFFSDDDVKTWNEKCSETMSEQRSGRSDWETIEHFYPQLITPGEGRDILGPRNQPLGITQIRFAPLPEFDDGQPFNDRYFYLADGDRTLLPGNNTRDVRVLLRTADGNWLLDLGRPEGNLINARGAKFYTDKKSADVLCAYRSTGPTAFGCTPVTDNSGDELQLRPLVDQMGLQVSPVTSPTVELTVTPVTSTTVELAVRGVPISETQPVTLYAQLFSPDFPSTVTETLTLVRDVYTGTLSLDTPSMNGYVVVWSGEIDSPTVFAVTDFSLGGAPALQYIWSSAYQYVWSSALQYLWSSNQLGSVGRANQWLNSGAMQYVWSGAMQYLFSGAMQYVWSSANQYVWSSAPLRSYAPAVSNDGQVMLYSPDPLASEEGEYLVLQSTTVISQPTFATLVGTPYRLAATDKVTLTGASLAMSYATGDVNPGEEPYLRIYFQDAADDDGAWQPLPTLRSEASNQVAAPVQGPGVYAIMSGIEIPLVEGWNLIGYPLVISSTVSNAIVLDPDEPLTTTLRPIGEAIQVIFAYDASNVDEPWSVFSSTTSIADSALVNTLNAFEYGRGYQIYATRPVTLLMTAGRSPLSAAGDTSRTPTMPVNDNFLQTPPAIFIADIPAESYDPTAALSVTAGGAPCQGSTLTKQYRQDLSKVKIIAYASTSSAGSCFAPGKALHFEYTRGGARFVADGTWNNEIIQRLEFVQKR